MNRSELLALVDDKAKRVLERPGLRVAAFVLGDGSAYVAVSGEAHVVEQRVELALFLSVTDDAAPAAIEKAVMELRPEFARTFPALRTEG